MAYLCICICRYSVHCRGLSRLRTQLWAQTHKGKTYYLPLSRRWCPWAFGPRGPNIQCRTLYRWRSAAIQCAHLSCIFGLGTCESCCSFEIFRFSPRKKFEFENQCLTSNYVYFTPWVFQIMMWFISQKCAQTHFLRKSVSTFSNHEWVYNCWKRSITSGTAQQVIHIASLSTKYIDKK